MTAAGMTPEMIRAIDPANANSIQRAYGWAAAFADIPELSGILDQAVEEQWTDDVLVAAIQNSDWARNRRQAQIDYEVNRRLHPADVAAEREQLELALQQEATKIGFTLTPERLDTLSGWILKNGLSPDEAHQTLLAEFHFDPSADPQGLAHGTAAATLEDLRNTAKSYLVPVSDAALNMWVEAIIKGDQDPASFMAWVIQQSQGMFKPLAGQISDVMNTQTLLDPYKNVLEQELGIANVDMSDPKYLGSLMTIDPKSGERTMPNLDQWRTTIRTNPTYNWKGTIGAQNMAAELADRLAVEMGAVAH